MPHTQPFVIIPTSLENIPENRLGKIPTFRITGKLEKTNCPVNEPFAGQVPNN